MREPYFFMFRRLPQNVPRSFVINIYISSIRCLDQKSHDIEIPGPKNRDIEIRGLKHHDTEKRRQLSLKIVIPRHFFRARKAVTSGFQD